MNTAHPRYGNIETHFGNGSGVMAAPKPKADRSEETKAAKALVKAMNVLSFDLSIFAMGIARAPIAVRRRFINAVYVLVAVWAEDYDNALWKDNEELDFLVDVKRIQETIPAFYKR